MKTALIILGIAVIAWVGGFYYVKHYINRHQDNNPAQTCPVWLMDSPQKGCL